MSLTLSTLAYVTYEDIRSISQFKDQTVIAINAPAETTLEVPDPATEVNTIFSDVIFIMYVIWGPIGNIRYNYAICTLLRSK